MPPDLPVLENGYGNGYDNYTLKKIIQNYEGYYTSVIYAYFSALGCDALIAEDHNPKVRIELTLKVEENKYIFEFKVVAEDLLSNTALQQIKGK